MHTSGTGFRVSQGKLLACSVPSPFPFLTWLLMVLSYTPSPLKEASGPLRWSKTMNRWGLGSEMSSQCSCFFQVCPSQGLPSTSVSPGGWTLPFLVLMYTPRPAAILTGLIRNKGFMGYQALWDCLVQLPVSRNQGIYSLPTGMNTPLLTQSSPLLHRHRLAQPPVSRHIRMLILPFAIRALNFR